MYAVGVSAGVGSALAAILAQAFSTGTTAGVGTSSGSLLAKASATAVTSGVATVSGTLTAAAFATALSAGVGSAAAIGISVAKSTALSLGMATASAAGFSYAAAAGASAGLGTAAGVLKASVFSSGAAAGFGTADGRDRPGSVAQAFGTSAAFAVSYAFYSDAEMAAPVNEVRVVYVPWEERNPITDIAMVPSEPRATYAATENRLAVASPEDRVYYTQRKPRAATPPNRRRKP